MKALITGINGFAGTYLCEALAQAGDEVYGTVVEGEFLGTGAKRIYRVDITDKAAVERVLSRVQPDAIYHLAGFASVSGSWKNPGLTFDVNVSGTINLLNAAAKHCREARILLIGSSEQYGIVREEDCPVSEEAPQHPNSPYAISKHTQEQLGILYHQAYQMNIIMTRSFNHIGPMQAPTFVVADFCKQAVHIERGLTEGIIHVGNLSAVRDFTDVRDIVQAYRLLICKGEVGQSYNVGSGRTYAISELLDRIIELSTAEITAVTDLQKMRPVDMPVMQADITKIKEHTGWSPAIALTQTLSDTLAYFREQV